MTEKVLFFEQAARNRRYSWVLLLLVAAALAVMSLVFSMVFAGVYGWDAMLVFLMFSTVFNIGYILVTYYRSGEIAVWSVGASEADENRHKQLLNVVEEMSIASGLPKPRTYVMPSLDINAFATGRDPAHSIVCVTEGALQKLSRQELMSVLAHEMSHIRNYDIRFVTLVAVMVGLVSILSQIFLRSMWYGGGGDRRGRGGGGLMMALMIAGIILAIVAPLIVKLVQLAISRKREYMADAGAVELTRYPLGLIAALEKIRDDYGQKRPHTEVNSAVAPLFFADPVKQRFVEFFQTHPPIEERIKALEKM